MDQFLLGQGLTDPALRQAFIDAGLTEPISKDATPLTHQRFQEIVVDHANSGKRWAGKLGDISTRVVTLKTAAEFERGDLRVEFEQRFPVGGGGFRDADLVVRDPSTNNIIRIVQFEKQDAAGNIVEGQPGAKADLERALQVPVDQVPTGPKNKRQR
jgi:hypothetical protein